MRQEWVAGGAELGPHVVVPLDEGENGGQAHIKALRPPATLLVTGIVVLRQEGPTHLVGRLDHDAAFRRYFAEACALATLHTRHRQACA